MIEKLKPAQTHMLLFVAIIPISDASKLLVPQDLLTSIAAKLVKMMLLFLTLKEFALQIGNKILIIIYCTKVCVFDA